MRITIAFLALIGYVQAISYADVLEAEWNNFKSEYGKIYATEEEEQLRSQIFRDNKQMIDKHNQNYLAGEETYEMGVNQFTDLLPKEFKSLMLPAVNFTASNSLTDFIYDKPDDVEIPPAIDWRSKGAVTRVKDQGRCGSCWAFAAVGSLEGQHFLKTGQLISLSEQNLLDCSSRPPYGNAGCKGGDYVTAFHYVYDNGGIDTESSYPYKAVQQPCRFDKRYIGATLRGIVRIQENSETVLAYASATRGPIAVAIDAGNLQFYHRGVYNNPSCNKQPNHAATVVGYGHDNQGGDYWLVKNSWGSQWGEHGYVRMSRNRNNQCQIASYAFFPLV